MANGQIAKGNDELTRSLTVSWQDPVTAAAAVAGMSGVEVLEAVLRGEQPIPPMLALMGIRAVEHEEGRAVIAVDPSEQHANNGGYVAHGGLAATLIDTAAWLALHSTMPPNSFFMTTQMSVNYLRPLRIGTADIRAEGRVLHRGRQAGTAEASVTDSDGKLCAHGSITCLRVG
jgi:uncharacterized protein (TIGR00369 family)